MSAQLVLKDHEAVYIDGDGNEHRRPKRGCCRAIACGCWNGLGDKDCSNWDGSVTPRRLLPEPQNTPAMPPVQPPRATDWYALVLLLNDCKEYLEQDPSTVGGRKEAMRLVRRINNTLYGGNI
jgi:hypothetical protein